MPEIIITPDNCRDLSGDFLLGYKGFCNPEAPEEHLPFMNGTFPLAKPFPRDEWDERIKEKDAKKSWLHDMVRGKKKTLHQNGKNHCWLNAGANGIMYKLVSQRGWTPQLAPSSMAWVVNWANVGGYASQCIKAASERGCCTVDFAAGDANNCNPRSYKQGWEQDALKHLVVSWAPVPDPLFDYTVSLCFVDEGCWGGCNWWRHAIYGAAKVRNNRGRYEILIDNSHGADFGEDGFGWLTEERAFDDAVVITQVKSVHEVVA